MGREGKKGDSLSQHLAQTCSLPSWVCLLAFVAPGRKEHSGLGPQGWALDGGGLISSTLQSRGNTCPLSQCSLVSGDGWVAWATYSPTLWPSP